MNTKHTPGPWKTRKGFDSETIEVFAPNPKIKKPFQPTDLAVVQADSREGKANARLIAAAPCLLYAVNYQLDLNHWIESADSESPFFEETLRLRLNTANDYMTAAIAKATGKEPA